MEKVKFSIQGMTCSSCSSHVEKAVNKLDGIINVNVNLLSNNMIVEFDEDKLKTDNIIKAVIEAGYGAELFDDKNKKELSKNKKVSNAEKNNNTNNNIDEIKSMKKRLIISICFLIPLMYISMHQMLFKWIGLPVPNIVKNLFDGKENSILYAFSQFLLLLPILYVNRNYFIVGFKRLFKRSPNMDSLIAIGSIAATIYGIFAIFMLGYGLGHNENELVERYFNDVYFESAGTILTLITLGKYLETKSKGKTSDAISKLINLAPKTAIIIRDNKEIEVEIEKIIVGDTILIKPGTSIPVDGIVIDGNSSVDQSSITGESIPVEKSVGDTVVSGTINKNGMLKIKATRVGDNTTLSQIIKLVEEASNSKAPISKIADKVSGIFVPTVITIALISIVIWLLLGESFEFTLSIGIAVLVISCPCALGLATPVAIMVGTGKGAENGILIKTAESLETLHSVDTVVLDKTGTITEGKPKVTDILTDIDERKLLQIAGSLEKNSEHPLAEAILKKISEYKINLKEVDEFNSISGKGIKGKIDGNEYYGGNLKFMQENNIIIKQYEEKIDKLLNLGKTCLYFANKTELIGIIAVEDTIKNTSEKAIQVLKQKNINVIMLTGDNKISAQTIGSKLKVDKIIAEVLPQDKEKEVEKLQSQGKKVAFVGDGINDSPALVKADVGIAIGSGTDIAIESADIVLIKNSLLDVVTAIDLSKAVINNIKMNLFWAFFYNIIGIPIAAGLFYYSLGLKLNPMLGAAAMSLSSVCVVTNALRLRKFKAKFINNNNSKYNLINNDNIDKEDTNILCECSINENSNKFKSEKEENEMNNVRTISVDGMQCNHCKMTVEKALNSIDGVKNAEVNLEEKTATFTFEKEINDETIKKVIEDAGFKCNL